MKSIVVSFFAGAFLCLCGCRSLSVCAREGKDVVVSSPYALELGSADYAKWFEGSWRKSHEVYQAEEGAPAKTNRIYFAEARLAKPCAGKDRLLLTFDHEKRLTCIRLGVARFAAFGDEGLTKDECQSQLEALAASAREQLGVVLTSYDREEDAKRSLGIPGKEGWSQGEKRAAKASLCGESAFHRTGKVTRAGRSVEVRLTGTLWTSGKYSVEMALSLVREESCVWRKARRRPVDYVAVRTNSFYSTSLAMTEAQKKAHEEAASVRAALVSLFGMDLDKPDMKVDFITGESATQAEPEWTKLPVPAAGMTERRGVAHASLFGGLPWGVCALRHVYEGDAPEAERDAMAKEFLATLEKACGRSIPAEEKKGLFEDKMNVRSVKTLPPTFGDPGLAQRVRERNHFRGRLGDLVIKIDSAAPRYEKRKGTYELAVKGALVVTVVQSPFMPKPPRKK